MISKYNDQVQYIERSISPPGDHYLQGLEGSIEEDPSFIRGYCS